MRLFDGIEPTVVVTVTENVNAALSAATPGTEVRVVGGVHPAIAMPKSGTPTAPIWLTLTKGAKIVLPAGSTASCISAWAKSYLCIRGDGTAELIGGKHNVLIGSGSTSTSTHIAVRGLICRDAVEDGIKFTGCDNGEIAGNWIYNSGKENIDGVECVNLAIVANYCEGARGSAAAIFVKLGCYQPIIRRNKIRNPVADGISVGGEGSPTQFRPGNDPDGVPFSSYQARKAIVDDNDIEGQGQNAIIGKGAVDSFIGRNRCVGKLNYPTIRLQPDDPTPPAGQTMIPCKNVEVTDNLMLVNQSVSVHETTINPNVHDNLPSGEWNTVTGPEALAAAEDPRVEELEAALAAEQEAHKLTRAELVEAESKIAAGIAALT